MEAAPEVASTAAATQAGGVGGMVGGGGGGGGSARNFGGKVQKRSFCLDMRRLGLKFEV